MRELECKLKLNEPARVIEKLTTLGAEYHGEVYEHNRIYDRNGELAAQQELLRLRVLDSHTWGILTHKRPTVENTYKCRIETETKVESAENMRLILESLGYQQDWFYEKKRRSWTLADCEIVIDLLPVLGHYIEIEAEDEWSIDRRLVQLGLDRKENLKINYRQIWRDFCVSSGQAFGDWRF